MSISDPRCSSPGCLSWLMKIWFLNCFFSLRPFPASFFEARCSLSPSPHVGPRQSSHQECSRGGDRCEDGENLDWELRDLVLPSEPPSCLCQVWKGQNPESWHSFHFRCLLRCEAEAWVVPNQGSKPVPPCSGGTESYPLDHQRRPRGKASFTALPSCLRDRALPCSAGGGGASRSLEGRGRRHCLCSSHLPPLSQMHCQGPCSAAASLSRILVAACILVPSPGVSVCMARVNAAD